MKTHAGSPGEFVPRWASPPGDTIRDAASDRQISLTDLANALSVPARELEELVSGARPITIRLAQRLEATLGGSVGFWIARDGQYREDLFRLRADEWARGLPTADMTAFGWMERPTGWLDAIAKSLDFFDIDTVEAWDDRYGSLVTSARFRRSRLRSDVRAVATWLRQAEVQADAVKAAQWDPNRFKESLAETRVLTTIRDPRRFVPRLTDLAAEAGVVVVIVRAPRGCPASGAARTLSNGRRLIVLSARHLSDDHFWFTFFHEAGHVLLHDGISTYVDEFEPIVQEAASAEESEADAFAEAELIGQASIRHLRTMPLTPREIVRAARHAGTSPGVIVGQLQHHGRLGFRTRLNGFKRRYRWDGPNLEMA